MNTLDGVWYVQSCQKLRDNLPAVASGAGFVWRGDARGEALRSSAFSFCAIIFPCSFGFSLQGSCSRDGSFYEKLLEACLVSYGADAIQLQVRPTAGEGQAPQQGITYLREEITCPWVEK